MKRPGAGRPGGNPKFKGNSNPGLNNEKMKTHPIWPGIERDKAITIRTPEIVYKGLSKQEGGKTRVPDWIKKASEALLWGLFLENQKAKPEEIYNPEQGFLIEEDAIAPPGSSTVEKILVRKKGKKLTIIVDLE